MVKLTITLTTDQVSSLRKELTKKRANKLLKTIASQLPKEQKDEPITLVGGIITTKFIKKVGKKGKKYTVKVETEKSVEQRKAEVLSKVFQV